MFEATLSDIQAHAIADYPNEACGLIVDGDYRAMENIADEPTEHFRMRSKDWLSAAQAGDIGAVVHSHPDGPDCPSAEDMRRQIATGVPWGIVSCNGSGALAPFWWGMNAIPPLIGRGFRHGVTDCYALIRDYFRAERGVVLPEFPRDWEWWCEGADLYSEGFPKAGFRRLEDGEAAAPGDVFLAQVRAEVPNHGGVLLDGGLALHHLTARLPVDATRLSRREPVDRWRKFITHWLRYSA